MQTIDPAKIKTFNSRLTIRKSKLSYVIMLIMFLFGTVIWGALGFGLDGGLIIRIFFLFFSFICLLFTLLIIKRTFDFFKSSNWIAALGNNEILIHQNILNKNDRESAVEIPLQEISSVKKVIEKRRGISDEGTETVRYKNVYLEFKLNNTGTELLKYFEAPFYIVDEKTFRIAWRDSVTRLTQSIKKFVEMLPINIERLKEENSAWKSSKILPDDEFVERVKQILAGGDKIGAIKLLRSRYNMGLKEAKEFVEGLED